MHKHYIKSSVIRLKEIENNLKQGQVYPEDLLKITRIMIGILKDKENENK